MILAKRESDNLSDARYWEPIIVRMRYVFVFAVQGARLATPTTATPKQSVVSNERSLSDECRRAAHNVTSKHERLEQVQQIGSLGDVEKTMLGGERSPVHFANDGVQPIGSRLSFRFMHVLL